MPTEKNVQLVAELEEDFKTSPLVIAANYRGLNVNEMQGMRRAVRESSARFKIAKNTLARIAADNAGRPELKEFMEGPVGFLTTSGDAAAAAKVLVKYIDDNSVEMTILGGALDGDVLTLDRIEALAKLPSKEVLLAKMMGSMNSPITGLVMVMSGPVRALATVLQRISEQGGAAAESEESPEEEPTAEEAPAPEAEAETDTEASAPEEAAEDSSESSDTEAAADESATEDSAGDDDSAESSEAEPEAAEDSGDGEEKSE